MNSRASIESHDANAAHTKDAVERHDEWSDLYSDLYAKAAVDPYRDLFSYGRYRLDRTMDRFLPPDGGGRRVLDVGCGTGHQMAALALRGYEVAGVDAAQGMLDHARANNPGAEVHLAGVDRLPFEADSFDYVICIEVLRHMRDSTPAVEEISRVLRPGGTALATAAPILNLDLYWLVNHITARVRIGNLRQLRQFFTTSPRLRKQFAAAGFREVDVHGVLLGPLAWIQRLARSHTPTLLRRWEPIDRALADRPLLRDLSSMYLVRAIR